MRLIITLILATLLASCVTPRIRGESPFYATACQTSGPTGSMISSLDALEVIEDRREG